jgi:hypothetical protein
MKMEITLRWRHEKKIRSGADIKMSITLRWRHENANYAQVET